MLEFLIFCQDCTDKLFEYKCFNEHIEINMHEGP